MAVTPIGPFCPFRSSAALQIEPNMQKLNTATPNFATDLARIQLEMQMGKTPDPEKLREVASTIEDGVDDWESLITRMNISNDFQTKEYGKLTQAHLAEHGQSPDVIGKMMRWQADCMRAMADNSPPPLPPPDLDVMKIMEEAQKQQSGDGSGKPPPSIAAMTNAEHITTTPFKGTEVAFESPNVREEYEKLCRDHAALIDMGGGYADFDPMGKLAFLDEIEKVEERWDIFFTRFKLMGDLNQDFIEQCAVFLQSMGLDESEFRELLRKAHNLMREEAERERP